MGKSKLVSVRWGPEDFERWELLAKMCQRNRSDVLKLLVREAIALGQPGVLLTSGWVEGHDDPK